MSEQHGRRMYKTLSLDAESLARLERYRQHLESQAPGMRVSLSAAARAAFFGLDDEAP